MIQFKIDISKMMMCARTGVCVCVCARARAFASVSCMICHVFTTESDNSRRIK